MIFLSHISYVRPTFNGQHNLDDVDPYATIIPVQKSQWQCLTIRYWIFLLVGNVYGWIEGKCGLTLLFQSKKEHHLPPNLPELGKITLKIIPIYFLDEKTGHFFLGGIPFPFHHLLGEFPRHLVEYSHWYGNSVGKHTWKRTHRPITWFKDVVPECVGININPQKWVPNWWLSWTNPFVLHILVSSWFGRFPQGLGWK